MSKKSKNKQKQSYTTLDDHTLHGKSLRPPFVAQLPITPMPWRKGRLPEIAWVALIFSQVPRGTAFGALRIVLDFVKVTHTDNPESWDVTLSGFGRWPEDVFRELLRQLLKSDLQKSRLRPLLLFEGLPARKIWQERINAVPSSNDWNILSEAVQSTLNFHSQTATDCCWLRVAASILGGKVRLSDQVPRTSQAIFQYSTEYTSPGDASLIRSADGVIAAGLPNSSWPDVFWSECFNATPCIVKESESTHFPISVGTTVNTVNDVRQALVQHWVDTRESSDIEPLHDCAFGMALYSLSILEELLRMGNSSSIVGRLALRTMVECHINLEYLTKKNDIALWQKYRTYSAGQAKLVFLKLEELKAETKFVDKELLRDFANEDMWEELVSIELGDWEESNLRSRAIYAGLKDVYDTYYAWTSQFAHAMWGATRQSVMDTCKNPLHRMHNIPKLSNTALPDLIPDACFIMDRILDSISQLVPGFQQRVQQNSVQP